MTDDERKGVVAPAAYTAADVEALVAAARAMWWVVPKYGEHKAYVALAVSLRPFGGIGRE